MRFPVRAACVGSDRTTHYGWCIGDVCCPDPGTFGYAGVARSVAEHAVIKRAHLCSVASGLLRALYASIRTQLNILEIHMYIGGGILGTILVLALIFYVLRRA